MEKSDSEVYLPPAHVGTSMCINFGWLRKEKWFSMMFLHTMIGDILCSSTSWGARGMFLGLKTPLDGTQGLGEVGHLGHETGVGIGYV